MASNARPVFAIFEGGGAKGVAHVGAVEALSRNGLEVIGVAGASAGAIVATLVSVGLTAREIMHPARRDRNILADHGHTPVSLLGESRWRRFHRLRRCARRAALATVVGGGLASLLIAPRTTVAAIGAVRRQGHFSTAPIEAFVNEVLRRQLRKVKRKAKEPSVVPDRITFRDLDYEHLHALRPLKIVATDVTSGSLVVFDRVSTPDVVVAEAVAASIAIPAVFQPVRIPSHDRGVCVFADGGLVSNLPVWVFAEEKLAFERANPEQPRTPIIGFTLQPKPEIVATTSDGFSSFEDYLGAVGRTALEGSQGLSRRFVEDLLVAPLETELDTLDFDADWPQLQKAFQDGYECADRHLRRNLQVKPDRVRAELKRLHHVLKLKMNARRKAVGAPKIELLRANLVEPLGKGAFQVTHAFNMDADADDRLVLDGRGRGAPKAFQTRTLVHAAVGRAWRRTRLDYMTKYERALVRAGIQSVISVPVFETEDVWLLAADRRPEPTGVFSVDSDVDLTEDFKDPQIRSLLATRSTLLFPALKAE